MDVSQWWRVFWMTFSKNHNQKCGRGARGYPGRLKTNDSWHLNIVGLLYGTCQRILSDKLNVQHIAAKCVLRLLSNDWKVYCIAVSTGLKEQAEYDSNFIFNIITGDKSWVFGRDPEKKQQPSQWKTPSSSWLKKAWQVGTNVQSMLICVFDIEGILHKEFVPPGQTVNGKFCCEVLRRLRENIRHQHPDKWRS
jgi:hypothetical protein